MAGIGIAWSKSSRGRCKKSAHVRDCACSRLVDVHLAKESARLPLESVGLRTAVTEEDDDSETINDELAAPVFDFVV